MTIPEILKELELYTGRFPMEAMKVAVAEREAITPDLLRVLETVAEDPLAWAKRKDYMLHLFAMHLLAQFREKRAYAPLVKIFSAPGETPYDLTGDMTASGFSRIVGSVYDGNPAPLHGMIESEEVNEFVRAEAMNALLVLERAGQMDRNEIVDYFRSLFHGKLLRQHSYAWDGLVCAVADLPAPELLEEVRRAFAEDLVDTTVADLEGIERDLIALKSGRPEQYSVITDAIKEMEWWASFHPEDSWPTKRPEDLSLPELPETQVPLPLQEPYQPTDYVRPQPVVRGPKIGRNDPCPCGSGKKYKKCCVKA